MKATRIIDALGDLTPEEVREVANQALQHLDVNHAIAAVFQALDEVDLGELGARVEDIESGEKTTAETLEILLAE